MAKYSVKSTLNKSFRAIKDNFFRYLFVVALVEILVVFMKRIVRILLRFGLNKGHLVSITSDNYLQVLKQPIVILTLFAVLCVTVLFVIIQFAILIRIVGDSFHEQKFSFKEIPQFIKRLVSVDILLIIPYVFLVIPNMNFAMSITYVSQFHLPEFIVTSIFQNFALTLIYLAGNAVFLYLNIRLVFTPIIYVMNPEKRFVDAVKESWKLTSRSFINLGFLIFISWLITMIISVVILYGIPAISALIELQFPSTPRFILVAIDTSAIVLLIIAISMWMILSIQMIVVRYYEITESSEYRRRDYKRSGLEKKLVLTGLLGFYILSFGYIYFDLGKMDEGSETLIISHRAESPGTIENTIEALVKVNEFKPDYVEIDVQITSDDEIVVFHDFNTKRLGTKNVKIAQSTLEELQNIKLSKDGLTSRIPTFEEFVIKAKELNQSLLIEFKAESFDNPLLTEKVTDILNRHDMFETSTFQSLDKKTITEYETKHPEAKTGFILGINFGELEILNVDFYSLEDSSITDDVVQSIIDNEKGLLVWTINDDLRLRHYFMSYLSGVITDDVEIAQEVKKSVQEISSFEILVYELMR